MHTHFQILFSLLRGGRTKGLRCRPFANSRNLRAFHPQDSLRRGRVPVQLKFIANSRQGQDSKIPTFCTALPAARRKIQGH